MDGLASNLVEPSSWRRHAGQACRTTGVAWYEAARRSVGVGGGRHRSSSFDLATQQPRLVFASVCCPLCVRDAARSCSKAQGVAICDSRFAAALNNHLHRVWTAHETLHGGDGAESRSSGRAMAEPLACSVATRAAVLLLCPCRLAFWTSGQSAGAWGLAPDIILIFIHEALRSLRCLLLEVAKPRRLC